MATILQPKRSAPPSPLSSCSSLSSSPSSSPSSTPAPRRKTMSITQTYYLAHKARAKLSNEAARSDHNLRLLVGHANLLDSLMIELADAEREQESWFNQSVRGAAEPQQQQHMHDDDSDDWAVEDDSESETDSDLDDDISDDDEDYQGEGEDEDEDIEMADIVSVRRVSQQHQLTRVSSRQSRRTPLPAMFDTIAEEEEDEEDCADLGLSKIPSYSTPPELDHDADTSEDEAMPPSPQQDALAFPPTTKDTDGDVVVPDSHEHDLADGVEPQEKPNPLYAGGYIVPPENPSSLLPAYARVY